ncbi:MAG: AAA family ATPase, partial [Sphingomonadales bacterium]
MNDKEKLDQLVLDYQALKSEIHKVIIGQDEVVDQVLIAIFSRAHCLLVGVPGLAKTLLVNTIA